MANEQALIQRIARTAHNIGILAGVGASELAGSIISYLAAHPEKIETFLRDGWVETIGTDDPWAEGCLSFLSKTGEILTPAELKSRKAAIAATSS